MSKKVSKKTEKKPFEVVTWVRVESEYFETRADAEWYCTAMGMTRDPDHSNEFVNGEVRASILSAAVG